MNSPETPRFDPASIDDETIERVRASVFITPVEGMSTEKERELVRLFVALREQARLEGKSPDEIVNAVLPWVSHMTSNIQSLMRDDYARETFAAAVSRLSEIIRGGDEIQSMV